MEQSADFVDVEATSRGVQETSLNASGCPGTAADAEVTSVLASFQASAGLEINNRLELSPKLIERRRNKNVVDRELLVAGLIANSTAGADETVPPDQLDLGPLPASAASSDPSTTAEELVVHIPFPLASPSPVRVHAHLPVQFCICS